MKVADIKSGYLLEMFRESTGKTFFGIVFDNSRDKLGVSSLEEWFPLNCLNDELKYSDLIVTKVYGRTCNMYGHQLSISDRNLLWQRPIPKRMTHAEVEALLGYPIVIVEEE